MKISHFIPVLLCCFLVSCGEDRRKEYSERLEANAWIEEVMREQYYWYEDIPESGKLNYYALPDKFFPTLLSSKEGKSGEKYSTIDAITGTETRATTVLSYSYGFEFERHTIGNNSSVYYARILYVLANSPAEAAGLKRGDWIMKINDIPINKYNYNILYRGGAAKLDIGKYSPKDEDNAEEIIQTGTKEIASAREVADNPVFLSTTLTTANGKVGYLVYNHFTSGVGDDDYSYDNDLKGAFNDFKSDGVSEFVLDLRYNPGGVIASARLLGGMLVPQSALDKVMCKVKFNDLNNSEDYAVNFTSEAIQNGSNLNLSRVFVLTTGTTSSVAEMLISALKPYMTVVVVGYTTEGKNVMTRSFTDPEGLYPWRLNPVVCEIYNVADETFSSGFTPTTAYQHNEKTTKTELLPLGDVKEPLLEMALKTIEGTFPPPDDDDDNDDDDDETGETTP